MGCMSGSRKKLPKDPNLLAHEIVRLTTEEEAPKRSPISEYLAKIGREGGLKGGKARAKKLSKKRRKQIAQKAAKSRWKKSARPS